MSMLIVDDWWIVLGRSNGMVSRGLVIPEMSLLLVHLGRTCGAITPQNYTILAYATHGAISI